MNSSVGTMMHTLCFILAMCIKDMVICSPLSKANPTFDLTVTAHCDDSTVPQSDKCAGSDYDPSCAKLYAAQEPGMRSDSCIII